MRIGILALQGAVEPHRVKLAALGCDTLPVRLPSDLAACAGLILPGGESTTMLKLMRDYELEPALKDFGRRRPMWGVCAGAILMAERVENPAQESLALLPITVRRNAYGRQNESFIARLALRLPGGAAGASRQALGDAVGASRQALGGAAGASRQAPGGAAGASRQAPGGAAGASRQALGGAPAEQEGVFIRAPQIVAVAPGVTVLAEHGGHPVAVQYGCHLASTFHPELSPPGRFHRHFVSLCEAAERAA